MRLLASANASLPVEPSGPGVPTLRFCEARRLVSRLTSASLQSFISSSLVATSLRSAGRSCQIRTAWAIGPEPRGTMAPPIETRSFMSVVSETRQPSPGVAEALGVRDAGVGEVDLVELGLAGHLAQRPSLDARCVHVDDEGREARVLGHVGIGPHDEQAPARHVGERRPDLLAVDDPLVAVAHAA